jgi:hypothetical protein
MSEIPKSMSEVADYSASAFRSRMAGFTNGRVPALAIGALVREHGAVYSSEILDRFFLSEATLRRRRPALARLGIRFLENGRGSIYAMATSGGIGYTRSAEPKTPHRGSACPISESTLRRRRPVLRRLGLVFVENGRGSFYASAELASQLPTDCLPNSASAATLRDAP